MTQRMIHHRALYACSHLCLHLCYTMFTLMFIFMLHHVHTYVFTYATPCSHLCYTMFTPMLHHVHTYVYAYVTPCSHLCLNICCTMFTPMLHHVYTYVTPCSDICLHLCFTMFTHMFTPMLHHVHTYVYTFVICYIMFTPMFTPMVHHVHTYVTPCLKKGRGNPFSDFGPQRGPYFLVLLISYCSLHFLYCREHRSQRKPQTESNYLSAEDDLECKVCERNCGKGFYTTHRLDHTAKSAARTGSSEEKLEKHKDYKFNQKLKNYLKIDALAGVDDEHHEAGTCKEKLEKHKDYKFNQKLKTKNYLKIDALAGVDDKQQLLHIPPETDNTIEAQNLKKLHNE